MRFHCQFSFNFIKYVSSKDFAFWIANEKKKGHYNVSAKNIIIFSYLYFFNCKISKCVNEKKTWDVFEFIHEKI